MYKLEDPKITGRPKKKFRCPACNKPKRFTRYVNAQGQYLSAEYGICDRINSCGYHKRPDAPFSYYVNPAPPPKEPPRRYIDWDAVELHFSVDAPFIAYLIDLFGYDETLAALQRYHVGVDEERPEFLIFTYIDKQRRLNRIKKQAYSRNGHRRKEAGSTFTPPQYTVANGYKQVLFGLHLYDPNKITCITESEKTALMASITYPEYTWMATGSMQNTGLIKNVPEAVLYPDKGKAFKYWQEKLNPRKYPCDPILEGEDVPISDGDDLGDLIEMITEAQ